MPGGPGLKLDSHSCAGQDAGPRSQPGSVKVPPLSPATACSTCCAGLQGSRVFMQAPLFPQLCDGAQPGLPAGGSSLGLPGAAEASALHSPPRCLCPQLTSSETPPRLHRPSCRFCSIWPLQNSCRPQRRDHAGATPLCFPLPFVSPGIPASPAPSAASGWGDSSPHPARCLVCSRPRALHLSPAPAYRPPPLGSIPAELVPASAGDGHARPGPRDRKSLQDCSPPCPRVPAGPCSRA